MNYCAAPSTHITDEHVIAITNKAQSCTLGLTKFRYLEPSTLSGLPRTVNNRLTGASITLHTTASRGRFAGSDERPIEQSHN